MTPDLSSYLENELSIFTEGEKLGVVFLELRKNSRTMADNCNHWQGDSA